MRKLQGFVNRPSTDTAHVLGEQDLLAVTLKCCLMSPVPVGAFMGWHKDLRLQYGVLCSSPPLPPLPPVGSKATPANREEEKTRQHPNRKSGVCVHVASSCMITLYHEKGSEKDSQKNISAKCSRADAWIVFDHVSPISIRIMTFTHDRPSMYRSSSSRASRSSFIASMAFWIACRCAFF